MVTPRLSPQEKAARKAARKAAYEAEKARAIEAGERAPDWLIDRCRGAQGRCQCPTWGNYEHYGGRGIEFRWSDKRTAALWMWINLKPTPDLELDRIDVDGHYEPGNVRFVPRTVNRCNTRQKVGVNASVVASAKARGMTVGAYIRWMHAEVEQREADPAHRSTHGTIERGSFPGPRKTDAKPREN